MPCEHVFHRVRCKGVIVIIHSRSWLWLVHRARCKQSCDVILLRNAACMPPVVAMHVVVTLLFLLGLHQCAPLQEAAHVVGLGYFARSAAVVATRWRTLGMVGLLLIGMSR